VAHESGACMRHAVVRRPVRQTSTDTVVTAILVSFKLSPAYPTTDDVAIRVASPSTSRFSLNHWWTKWSR
jgi:hypothetical protein